MEDIEITIKEKELMAHLVKTKQKQNPHGKVNKN